MSSTENMVQEILSNAGWHKAEIPSCQDVSLQMSKRFNVPVKTKPDRHTERLPLSVAITLNLYSLVVDNAGRTVCTCEIELYGSLPGCIPVRFKAYSLPVPPDLSTECVRKELLAQVDKITDSLVRAFAEIA